MAQHLVAALGVGVVVAVPLQLEQRQVGEQVVGVPAVRRGHPLVAALVGDPAVQAVVLDVVDHFQGKGGHEALRQEEQHAHPAERQTEGHREQRGDRIPPDQLVVAAEVLLTLALQILLLQLPGVQEVVLEGARQELVQALVVLGRGRVFWRGHMHVVATDVLHLKAGVGHRGEQQAAHPVLQLGILVHELMAQVDGDDAAHGANGDNPAQLAEQGVVVIHEHPAGEEQHAQPDKAHQEQRAGVDALLAHGRHLLVLVRVGRVLADDVIEHRNDAEHHEIQEPGPIVLGAGLAADEGAHGQQRQHRRPEGQITPLLKLQHRIGMHFREHGSSPPWPWSSPGSVFSQQAVERTDPADSAVTLSFFDGNINSNS